MYNIGFMQGRLCDRVNGMIQAFPWQDWKTEFAAAAAIGLHMMEWTLDQERLHENPLMTESGQRTISDLCQQHQLTIPSLTGDCFMQAPFWKEEGTAREALQSDFLAIGRACAKVGIRMMVVPLVDNGRIENSAQEDVLVAFLLEHEGFLAEHGLQVIFEADFVPSELARFIARLPSHQFGVNYDIGNSASLGFNPEHEFAAYGERIVNVHVKDRSVGGTTVPLGTGGADFDTVFAQLANYKYAGNYIMQTARAADDQHAAVLTRYKEMIEHWVSESVGAV